MQRLARSPAPVAIFLNKSDESCRERAFREAWDRAIAHAEARASEVSAAPGGASPPGEPQNPEKPWKRKRREAGELRPIVRPRWLSGSAKTGEGVDALLDALFGLLPAGPLLFDGDTLTDHPEKLAVADVIREKLFGLFRDELPHSIGVSVERVERRGDGSVAVSGTVYVRKANQKGIVLGEKGRTLRTAKRRAEAELRDYFGAPAVDCELWVRVEPDWNENFFLLRKLGYA